LEDNLATISIAILTIIIIFSWIGYAYVMGAEPNKLILHPIVPLLLIPVLLKLRRIESTRLIGTIAMSLIGIWLLIRLRSVFMPFIIGFSIAYVVNAILLWLQDIHLPKVLVFRKSLGKKERVLRLPRWGAALVLSGLFIGIICFLSLVIVPQLVDQGVAMQEGIISLYERTRDYTANIAEGMGNGDYPFRDRLPESWQEPVGDYVDRIILSVQDRIPSIAQSASQIVGSILSHLSSGLIGTIGRLSSGFFIIIVFVYVIQSFQANIQRIKNIIPESQRATAARYLTEIDGDMRAFLKGQIAIILIIGIISAIGYSIIRIPFALLVGMMAGLCNAIPTVGPVIGGGIAVLASITGFAAGNYGLGGLLLQIVLVIGVVFGIQLLDNSLISPKIMSRAVEVHPLVVMFAVLLAASLIGIWGAVLTIPGVVIVKGIIKVSGEIRSEKNAK